MSPFDPNYQSQALTRLHIDSINGKGVVLKAVMTALERGPMAMPEIVAAVPYVEVSVRQCVYNAVKRGHVRNIKDYSTRGAGLFETVKK